MWSNGGGGLWLVCTMLCLEESEQHLLYECTYAKLVWQNMLRATTMTPSDLAWWSAMGKWIHKGQGDGKRCKKANCEPALYTGWSRKEIWDFQERFLFSKWTHHSDSEWCKGRAQHYKNRNAIWTIKRQIMGLLSIDIRVKIDQPKHTIWDHLIWTICTQHRWITARTTSTVGEHKGTTRGELEHKLPHKLWMPA